MNVVTGQEFDVVVRRVGTFAFQDIVARTRAGARGAKTAAVDKHVVMSNSFGFGGHNVSVLFGRY
jgi:3-oxoacyl-(acyl-carrier-protein) synthase